MLDVYSSTRRMTNAQHRGKRVITRLQSWPVHYTIIVTTAIRAVSTRAAVVLALVTSILLCLQQLSNSEFLLILHETVQFHTRGGSRHSSNARIFQNFPCAESAQLEHWGFKYSAPRPRGFQQATSTLNPKL